jgi:hypothetical protein
MLTVTAELSPLMLTRAFNRSKASWMSWRDMPAAPRLSIAAVMGPSGGMPVRLFSSPRCSTSRTFTAAARVRFGKSAVRMPLASFTRSVRLSMFSGVASKASPCTTGASPL